LGAANDILNCIDDNQVDERLLTAKSERKGGCGRIVRGVASTGERVTHTPHWVGPQRLLKSGHKNVLTSLFTPQERIAWPIVGK
jgi:hypothetical protein